MLGFPNSLLLLSGLIPHGHCYLWKPELVWLHCVADTLTALAYYSIPVLLFYLTRKRHDLPFNWIFLLFGSFIIACGSTHLMAVWTLWHPTYWFSGVLKLITAIVSLYTAVKLSNAIPQILALPSHAQLEQANQKLQQEVVERQRAEAAEHQYTIQLQQGLNLEALLKRITDKVRDSLDEEQIFKTAVTELGQGLGVKCCHAALYNLEQGTAVLAHEYTTLTVSFQGQVLKIGENLELYRQLWQGRYFQLCPLTPDLTGGQTAILMCPIVEDQEVLGDLRLVTDPSYVFRELELRLVQQVANQCAIAIRQARLYRAAQVQVQELERLNRLKDDFLSTVSHELRTPMVGIKMATQMLEVTLQRKGVFDDGEGKTLQYFQILQKECQREINLINDLLDLSYFETETQPSTQTEIALQSWMPYIIEPFRERIQRQQQRLQVAIPDDLPDLTINSSILGRILTELLNNACKYTPPGETITVSARMTRSTQAGNELPSLLPHPSFFQVSISNSGVEIAVAERDRIFDKFYRIPNNDPWKFGGTGLGLALVKRLVEQLGATIQVESSNNQTTFNIQLPIRASMTA